MRPVQVVALLFAGYAGYYFCRANLSATAPLIIADLHAHGWTVNGATVAIGTIASLGTLGYAFGKFFLAPSADFFGGKRSFLTGMGGAIAFTILFASGSGVPVYALTWSGNRLLQSIGWASLIKVASQWVPYATYGTVMGILSLSFLVGDAVTRSASGALIAAGFGWRSIFFYAAGALATIFFINLILLKESSVAAGLEQPPVNPRNLFGEAGAAVRPQSLRALVQPLLASKAFVLVCALSFGTTLLREALATWTPTYFVSGAGLGAAQAAGFSAVAPAAGIVSVLLAGVASDRSGSIGRARIACVGLILTACSLAALALLPKGAGTVAIAFVGAVAFFNAGPYSYLAGAMALDFGGRTGSATTSGIIDGAGYLGGALAGFGIAQLAVSIGWGGAFSALTAVTALTAVFAALLVYVEKGAVRESI